MGSHTETVLVINSEVRSSGTTQQYTIPINPPIHDVVRVELLSFDGTVTPYNVLEDQFYSVRYCSKPPTGIYAVSSYEISIRAGCWTLLQLFELLNANPWVIFSRDRISGKIIVTEKFSVTDPGSSRTNYVWGVGAPINDLLGFPATFTVPLFIPIPGWLTAQWMITGNEFVRQIQSTYPVSSIFKPLPIQIAFENIAGQLSSTNNIGGCFVVTVDPVDPETNESIVNWKQQNDYIQWVNCNHIRISNVGIRLCDSILGSPYKYPGEHTIILKVTWINNR